MNTQYSNHYHDYIVQLIVNFRVHKILICLLTELIVKSIRLFGEVISTETLEKVHIWIPILVVHIKSFDWQNKVTLKFHFSSTAHSKNNSTYEILIYFWIVSILFRLHFKKWNQSVLKNLLWQCWWSYGWLLLSNSQNVQATNSSKDWSSVLWSVKHSVMDMDIIIIHRINNTINPTMFPSWFRSQCKYKF